MSRLNQILVAISVIGIIIFFLWRHLADFEKTKNENKDLKIETNVQHEVIEKKRAVAKRQAVNETFSSDANFEWLFANRCKDCTS